MINQVLSFHLVVNSVIYFSNDDNKNSDSKVSSKLVQSQVKNNNNKMSPGLESTTTTTTTSKTSDDQNNCPKRKHIMFLKTHKCASSSIQNILLRFGDSKDLFFALPKTDNYLGHPTRFSRRFVLDPFMLKNRYNLSYSIIAHHLRFNYKELVSILPEDTIFITILRDPVKLFESLFVYYDYAWNAFRQNLTLDQFALLFQDDKRFSVGDDQDQEDDEYEHPTDDEKKQGMELLPFDDVNESENDAAEKVDDDRQMTSLTPTSFVKTSNTLGNRFDRVLKQKNLEQERTKDLEEKEASRHKKRQEVNNKDDSDVYRSAQNSDLKTAKHNVSVTVSSTENAFLRRQPITDDDDRFNQRLHVRNGINYHMTSLVLKEPEEKMKRMSKASPPVSSWSWTSVFTKFISGTKDQPQEEDLDNQVNEDNNSGGDTDKKVIDSSGKGLNKRRAKKGIQETMQLEKQAALSRKQSIKSSMKLDANFRVRGRYGRNQMAFDLGFNQKFFDTPRIISNFIDAIDSMFHLVLITEKFDESLILLKHLLCWSNEDVITFQHNMRAEEYSQPPLSSKGRKILKKLNLADQMIYDHFATKFDKILHSFGKERMNQEVNDLKNLTAALYKECVEAVVPMHEVLPKIYWPNSKVVAMKSRDFTLIQQQKQHRNSLNEVDHHDHEDNDEFLPEEDVVNNDDNYYPSDAVVPSSPTMNSLQDAKEKSILCQQLTLPEIVYTDNLRRKQQIMLRNRKLGLSSSLNPIHHLMMKPEAAAAAAFDHNHRFLQVDLMHHQKPSQAKTGRRRNQTWSSSSLHESGVYKSLKSPSSLLPSKRDRML